MSSITEIAQRLEDQEKHPDVIHTGVSIKDAKPKSTKEYKDDIVDAAVFIVAQCPHIAEVQDRLAETVEEYHAALRQADRERK